PTQLCGGRPTKRKLFDFLLLVYSQLCGGRPTKRKSFDFLLLAHSQGKRYNNIVVKIFRRLHIQINISSIIRSFVTSAIEQGWVDSLDRIYTTNRLMSLIQINELEEGVSDSNDLLSLMDQLTQYAIEQGIIENIGY